MVKIARSSVVRRYEVNRIKKTKTYHSIISLYLKQKWRYYKAKTDTIAVADALAQSK